jgi:uncharacterized damage-inducible protein DinB
MEAKMAIRDSLLPEFDMEMATTRKTLERVPEDKTDWKPHNTSMAMGRLAGHIAEMAGFAAVALKTESFDFAPPGGAPMQPTNMTSRKQILDVFDTNVAEARALLARTSDEDLMKVWTLMNGGKTFFAMPKIQVLRGMIFNHLIHHRGQLTVYLRMNQVPVPSLYGPSGDEGKM